MNSTPRVALFVTCLVDLHRPSVAFASIALLEAAGCAVEVPRVQTCCGQPAYNAGDRATARSLGLRIIEVFSAYDYIVAPSGSCAGMISRHLQHLFDDDPNIRAAADALAAKTFELTAFLVDILHFVPEVPEMPRAVTYHDSCAGLRELGIKSQPRVLLAAIPGLTMIEMATSEVCCGFGGTFCIKYPDVSNRMAADKAADIEATQAGTLLAGDMGCLLNIAGRLSRGNSKIVVRHIAEVLAGTVFDTPPISQSPTR